MPILCLIASLNVVMSKAKSVGLAWMFKAIHGCQLPGPLLPYPPLVPLLSGKVSSNEDQRDELDEVVGREVDRSPPVSLSLIHI